MAKRMKVYVAGPYSSDNVLGVLSNIRKGINKSYVLLQQGFAPFSPWLDYHFVLEDYTNDLTVQDFYEYSMEWLRVSDAVLVQGNWQSSKGTIAEIKEAETLGIPVFHDLTKLILYARGKGFEV
jgi:nucleoside 2-deoxyribosyltransferase